MKITKEDIIDEIKETINSRTLFYTGMSVLLNGMDKTSLELVQMGRRNVVKKRLKKKFCELLKEPLDEISTKSTGDIVWTSWLQGEDLAPKIVKRSIDSMRSAFPNKKVIVVSKHNMNEYVDMPDFITTKWKNGKISNTHFSDILRTYLLITYGGIWIDATVLVKSIPDNIKDVINKELFFFQNLRPGQSGNAIWLSSWFISARKGEPCLKRTYELMLEYWSHNSRLKSYFLFHIFLHLVLDENPSILESMKKVPNSLPLMMLYKLRENIDKCEINGIFNQYPIQKLTYKKMPINNSNYNYLEENKI
jgi:hypothetical protein